MDKLRLLYIGMKNDYGSPALGECYEWSSFLPVLQKMAEFEVKTFPFDEVLRKYGRDEMNKQLFSLIKTFRPKLCFFSLFTDEFQPKVLNQIRQETDAITLNWFADDHWRLNTFSKLWCSFFHYIITTDHESVEKYRALGYTNVILSQWAYRRKHEKNSEEKRQYSFDVSFIGQAHSNRRKIIRHLYNKGITVACWGKGWKQGKLPRNDMIRIFRESKINLNFSESSNSWKLRRVVKLFLRRRCDNTYHWNNPKQILRELQSFFFDRRPQIKARNFEIPGYGGFLLTPYVQGLEDYYELGKEIVVYHSMDELIDFLHYYLEHDDERDAIQIAGTERTLKDHTYEKRFYKIFNDINIF